MSKIEFEDYVRQKEPKRGAQSQGKVLHPDVFYFKLAEGEEAIVRFMYEDTKEFDLETVHTVQHKGRFTKVSCNRGGEDHCVFCDNNVDVRTRFFVKMLQYTIVNGKVEKKAVVWDRPAGYANELASFAREYGPLKNSVFKIRRTGHGLDTKYTTLYANPAMYKPEIYTPDTDAFDNWEPRGMMYARRSNEQMQRFLDTGEFFDDSNEQASVSPMSQSAVAPKKQQGSFDFGAFSEEPSPFAPAPQPKKEEQAAPTTGPRRTYNY